MSELHLTRDELLVWRDEGAGDRDRIVAHLARCADCRHVAAELERLRPAEHAPARFDANDFVARGYGAGGRAPAAARGWRLAALPAAAVILLAVFLLPRWLDRGQSTDPVLRGADGRVVIVQPRDATIAVSDLRFEWTVDGELDRPHLQVFDLSNPGEPLIRHAVTGTTYDPTPDERGRLPKARDLYWFVEYRDQRGVTVTSPAARFALR